MLLLTVKEILFSFQSFIIIVRGGENPEFIPTSSPKRPQMFVLYRSDVLSFETVLESPPPDEL